MSTVNTLADNLQLTVALAAGTNEAKISGLTTHTLFVNYSPDTNSTNTLELRIDVSPVPTGDVWHPFHGNYADSSGVLTQSGAKVLTYTSDGTADQLQAPYTFSVTGQRIRVRAIETNAPADYGNYTAVLFSSKA